MDIKAFRGLNNVTDPMRLGMDWLVQADNVDITDTGELRERAGYTQAQAGSFSAIFSTFDFQRCYVVKAGVLQTIDGVLLATLTSSNTLYWTEVNDEVYFNNGVDSGVIYPDNTVGLWRDKPVSYGAGFLIDDGSALPVLYDTLALGADVVQFWKGRMYAAQYFPSDDQTVVWFSEPLGYHIFNNDSNFFTVPGRVRMLAPTPDALIVGTDSRISAYDEKSLTALAQYGVVPGQHWCLDEQPDGSKRTLFWSTRGLCAALPFSNLTERQVSVAPGVSAGGTIVRHGGQKRYVVALQQGGAAFNPYV
jgi:hypothetical protein